MTFAELVEGRIVPMVDAVVIPLFYALAFLFFLVGVVRYYFSESEKTREEGRNFVIWSVIAFAVMFSVWGLVRILLSLLA